jgi:hypothetical protein
MTNHQKITDEEIRSGILEAWNNGEDITPSAMEQSPYKKFYKAYSSHGHFKYWKETVENTGTSYKDVELRHKKIQEKKRIIILETRKKEFLEELVTAHNNHINLSGGTIQKDKVNSHLYHRAKTIYRDKGRLFWETALKESNLPLDEIIIQQNWTPKKIILTLQEKVKSKEDLSSNNLGTGLEKAIHREYGSKENALIKAKKSPKKLINYRRETDDDLINGIKKMHSCGINLNYTTLLHSRNKNYKRLVSKSIKRFKKAWGKIVEEKAGIDYTPYIVKRTNRTKDKILLEIKEIEANGEPLNIGYMQDKHPALVSAAQTAYKSWRATIEAYGLNYADVKKQIEPLSKKEIRKRIRTAHDAGRDLSISAMLKLDKKDPLKEAYHASFSNFENWKTAIKEEGLDYEKIRRYKSHSIRSIANTVVEAAKNDQSLKPSEMTDPTLKQTYAAAQRRNIPWKRFIEQNNIKLDYTLHNSWKNENQILNYLRQTYTTGVATGISKDKHVSGSIKTFFNTAKEAAEKAGLIYSRTGRIDGAILDNKCNTEILYKYNQGFLQEIVDDVYHSLWDKVKNRIDKQDLEIEAFAIFIESLHEKPAKANLRDYTKPIIVEGLKSFMNNHYKEVLFTKDVFFDLQTLENSRMNESLEDEYISRIDNGESFE